MRHHILALNGFVKERDWDQLEAYLRDYADLIPESTTVFCKESGPSTPFSATIMRTRRTP